MRAIPLPPAITVSPVTGEETACSRDRVSGWRWLLGAFGVGTYRQNDSVDIRYTLDGRPMVAEGLPNINPGNLRP